MPLLKNNVVEVLPNTFWMMLLCTVRYTLGRGTYQVSDTVDLVRKSFDCLNADQLSQLGREINRELTLAERNKKTVGHKMDHEEWQKLLYDIHKKLG